MPRNLDRRVEALAPIQDPEIARRVKDILALMLADNRQTWELQPDGQYLRRRPGTDEPERSAQKLLMEMALQGTLCQGRN